jgi:holin-like protein
LASKREIFAVKLATMHQLTLIALVGISGTTLSIISPVSLPPSILGMILLLILISTRIVHVEKVSQVAHLFLAHMGVMFVPPVVGIADSYKLLGNHVVQFMLICVIAMVLTFLAALGSASLTLRLQRKFGKWEDEIDD